MLEKYELKINLNHEKDIIHLIENNFIELSDGFIKGLIQKGYLKLIYWLYNNNYLSQNYLDQFERINIHQKPQYEYLNIIKLFKNVALFQANNCNIENIDFLSELYQLEAVHIYHNNIQSLEPLRNLKKLKYINIGNNNITSLEPVSQLYNLEKLRIENNEISTLKPLNKINNLRILRIKDNNLTNIEDLEGIENKKQLIQFSFDYEKIENTKSPRELIYHEDVQDYLYTLRKKLRKYKISRIKENII